MGSGSAEWTNELQTMRVSLAAAFLSFLYLFPLKSCEAAKASLELSILLLLPL